VCLVARAQHAALLQADHGGALHVLAKTFDGPERIEAHEFRSRATRSERAWR
jgi:hypothetical protein